MKIILFLFIILLFAYCCKTQLSEDDSHKLLVEEILNETIDDGVIIFAKSDVEDEIVYMTIYTLQKIYKNDTTYIIKDNKNVIADILDFKVPFGCNGIIKCFSINDVIKKDYEDKGISYLLSTYCTAKDNNIYAIRSVLSYDEQLSIIYYLYENNYFSSFDDLLGVYYCGKMNEFIKAKGILELEESQLAI